MCFRVACTEAGDCPVDREVTVSKIYTQPAGMEKPHELCASLKFDVN